MPDTKAEVKPTDVGSAETQPGQTEIVAGSVEHSQVLSSFPNASSYGPDVNVVLPPEEPPPEAPASLGGAVQQPVRPPDVKPEPTTKGSTKGSS